MGFSASFVGKIFTEYHALIRILGGIFLGTMGLFLLETFNSGSIIIFVLSLKNFKRKQDLVLIVIGVTAIALIDKEIVWISIWVLLLIYFLIKEVLFKK